MKRLRKHIIITMLIPILFASNLYSKNKNEPDHEKNGSNITIQRPDHDWFNGPYFTAGLGLTYASFTSADETNRSFTGCHITPSIGYWANGSFGIGISAFINYSYYGDLSLTLYDEQPGGAIIKRKISGFQAHIWNSSFFLTVFVRIPFVTPTDNFNPFLKVFAGYGINMTWLKGNKAQFVYREADRYFTEGPAFGVTLGNLFNTFNDSRPWFIQISGVFQFYQEQIAIQDTGVLPREIGTIENSQGLFLFQIHVTVGIRLF